MISDFGWKNQEKTAFDNALAIDNLDKVLYSGNMDIQERGGQTTMQIKKTMVGQEIKKFGNNYAKVVLLKDADSSRYAVCIYQLEERIDGLHNQKIRGTFTTDDKREAFYAYQRAIKDLSKLFL